MCRILTQSYACEHKVELGRMPDLPDCGGECKGSDTEETVLPASVSVCEPCALAKFSGAIIEIDRVKPATSGPVNTSDETQALPQFLFQENFPPSPPAQRAVLANVAPTLVQPVGNQTASTLQVNIAPPSAQSATGQNAPVNAAPLSAPTATNQSAQVITGQPSAPQATTPSAQTTIPSISAPATASTSASPPFQKAHRRSIARGHVCSLLDYIKMYIFAGLPCPKTATLGDGNLELTVNTGLAARQRRGY